jgi:hypothetical protein
VKYRPTSALLSTVPVTRDRPPSRTPIRGLRQVDPGRALAAAFRVNIQTRNSVYNGLEWRETVPTRRSLIAWWQ